MQQFEVPVEANLNRIFEGNMKLEKAQVEGQREFFNFWVKRKKYDPIWGYYVSYSLGIFSPILRWWAKGGSQFPSKRIVFRLHETIFS